jgi:hypothetical protein
METAVAMAVVMGRTLVLPPQHEIYHLFQPHKHARKGVFGFDDFFHLESVRNPSTRSMYSTTIADDATNSSD